MGKKNCLRFDRKEKQLMIGTNIVSVIVLLGVLVFVHELGHFLFAKWFGVGVLKFSLGFGPKLVGRKYGETEYLISAIPLGGYVKMLGESGTDKVGEEDMAHSFSAQRPWKRFCIVAAGPAFNFLFAVLVLAIMNMTGIPTMSNLVGGVQQGSAAAAAGIEAGDRIVAIDGNTVTSWPEIAEQIAGSDGREMKLKIDRAGRTFEISAAGRLTQGKNLFGEDADSYRLGIQSSQETFIKRQNPLSALMSGVAQTWFMTELTFLSIVKIIQGTISASTLGGPILIAQMAGSEVEKGIMHFIFFMAILSINLGVLNLLPIPVLDGGHLFFTLIEVVTGREVNIKWREMAQQVGFFLLILLMLFVFYNDIMRIFS
jgi:regulator of sigma E protease